jgi:hypothetical protein
MKHASVAVYGEGFGPGFEPGDMPAKWWRKIELAYPDGKTYTLVYERQPADSRELPDLMLKLQAMAGKHGFCITVTDKHGVRTGAGPFR